MVRLSGSFCLRQRKAVPFAFLNFLEYPAACNLEVITCIKFEFRESLEGPLDSEEAVNLAIAKLKAHLLDLVRKKVELIVE